MASELWQRIRAVRKHMGLNQEDFGDIFGKTKAAVSQWESVHERGRTQPVMDTLMKMSQASGAPLDWLMSDASDCEFEFWAGDSANADDINMQIEKPPSQKKPLTAEAQRLAELFDLIPEAALIKRAVAYNTATAAIVAALEDRPAAPTSQPAPDQKR